MTANVICADQICLHWLLAKDATYDNTWQWNDNDVAVSTAGGSVVGTFTGVLNGGALVTANAGNGKLTVNTTGLFTWNLSPSDIDALGDNGHFQVVFTESGGDVRVPFAGTYEIKDRV
jgi:hypothetical protein